MYKAYDAVLRMFDLKQIIKEPTRITTEACSLLDHILCNNTEKIVQLGTITVGLKARLHSKF